MPQPQPIESVEDGDTGFTGLDEFTQPAQVAAGGVSAALNTRFTESVAAPRLGVAKLTWTNQVTSTSPTPLPFGTIYGAVDFRDPNGVEWAIIAADGKVFRTRANNGRVEVPLPAGVVINYPVTFEQCFDGLILFRGEKLAELILEDLDIGFLIVSQQDNLIGGAGTENPTDGTEPIPFAVNGDWIGNRLFIPYSKDLLGISDYLNPTRYAGVRSQARINQGSEDALVRFFKFSDNTGIAFKEQSIYIMSGITGDLSTMTLDQFTTDYGLAAAKSCINVGSDTWFLSERRGICSIYQTELNAIQGKDVPVSHYIKNLIGRINWRYAGGAVAAYYDNKYYLAVPLDDATVQGYELVPAGAVYDGAGNYTVANVVPTADYYILPGANELFVDEGIVTANSVTLTVTGITNAPVTASVKRIRSGVNNAVLVYDFLQQRWAGADTGSAICVQEWIKLTYEGARRLFALTADGFINLYEEMPYDETVQEITGANLIAGNFDATGKLVLPVTAGKIYSYLLGGNTINILNGNQNLNGAGGIYTGIFTANGSTLTLTGTATLPPQGQINEVVATIVPEWIAQDTTTRGYTAKTVQRKRWLRVTLEVETWYPEFSVYAITEGASELLGIVEDKTKNFLKYERPWDRANWDPTNANNDHAAPYRQDYAIVLGDATTPSGSIAPGLVYLVESPDDNLVGVTYHGHVYFSGQLFTGLPGVPTYTVLGTPNVYGPGNYFNPGANGVNPDQTQESTEKLRFPLQCRGKQVQIRIVTTRGRVSLKSCSVEGMPADRTMGSKV